MQYIKFFKILDVDICMQNLHSCTQNTPKHLGAESLAICSKMFCSCLNNNLMITKNNNSHTSNQCVQSLDLICNNQLNEKPKNGKFFI